MIDALRAERVRAAIESAMRQSQAVVEKSADEHWHAFTAQMREKIGVETVALDEPYLPFALVRAELDYLRRLDKLQKRQANIKFVQIDIPGTPPEEYGDEVYTIPGEEDFDGFDEDDDFDEDDEDSPDSEWESDIDREINQSILSLKQDLDSKRQQAFGITHYVWSGGDCPLCAPYNGEIFEWGEGEEPGSVHPNCNCSAEPVTDGEGGATSWNITPEDIANAALLLASLTPHGRAAKLAVAAVSKLGKVGKDIIRLARRADLPKPKIPSRGKNPPAGGRADTQWKFGRHKSANKWKNQMEQRGWTEEKITDTIKNGKAYPAPNNVRKYDPGATATRYEKDGKFIVRDDQTGEILQIGGKGEFIPLDFSE